MAQSGLRYPVDAASGQAWWLPNTQPIAEAAFFDAASGDAVGAAAAAVSVSGVGVAVSAADGAAASAVTVSGAGAVIGGGAGAAAVTVTASGVGEWDGEYVPPAETEERPAGGYGWQNLANAKRQREARRWTEEDEAELRELVQARIAQAEAPDDLARIRALVASYEGAQAEYLTRRGQRAIEYAQRAQTELALRLAAREIERFEEDAITALLVLALAA